jgi:chorismate mutase/prephenate dehydratase
MPRELRAKAPRARARTIVVASFCPSVLSPNRTAPAASLQNTGSQVRPRAERRMLRKASIPALRQQIDRIDDQLLRLLSRRAELALAIAEQKARSNAEVYAPGREKGVLERLARANPGPLPAPLVRAIFREIISASRSLEQRLRIAYLGPEATFTHLAARQQFGAGAEYLPATSVADVFHEVESARADLGVVPVENSTEGMVAHTLDLLADSPLQICAEISLPVRHNLLARDGTGLGGITRVVAHPQALAQCRRWLAVHLPAVPERARAEQGVAAIAGEAAADTYGLAVFARAINDEPGNLTRFVVLAPHDTPRPTGDDKTSILFSVRDEVGILARMLKPFAAHGIDLIKIESRPLRGRPWEYVFYLDLKGHRRERRVQQALAEVERGATRLKVLGSYPAAPAEG